MKTFLKKVLQFSFLFLCLVVGVFLIKQWQIGREIENNDLFVWGDSQISQAIDLRQLEKKAGINVISSAEHGAGLYDFLVFTECVPKKSRVLVALSAPACIRDVKLDRNMSGLSMYALMQLFENGYSYGKIFAIAKRNFKFPENIFHKETELYDGVDSVAIKEQTTILAEAMVKKNDYFQKKINLYLAGIKKLQEKECDIVFISFPFHQTIDDLVSKSKHISSLKELEKQSMALIKKEKKDTITVDCPLGRCMFDVSHYNQKGAISVTDQLAKKIKFSPSIGMIFVHNIYE